MKQLELFRKELNDSLENSRLAIHAAVQNPSPQNMRRLVLSVRRANRRLTTLHRAEIRSIGKLRR